MTGAGSGRLLIRLGHERPYRLVALDYAPYAMRAVRENYRRAGATGSVLFGLANRGVQAAVADCGTFIPHAA